MVIKLSERERAAILNSLAAGVVPRLGLHHIQVGRKAEISAVLEDLKRIEAGASCVRFVVGRFGSGKSFFLNLLQTVAVERKLVVLRADLTTERKLHATNGQARALFSELMKNLATKGKPEGGALGNVIERWISDVAQEVLPAGGTEAQIPARLAERCRPLQDLVGGFDFVQVVTQYYKAYLEQNDSLKSSAIRWLRGEYATKTEARQDLGVRSIIGDDSYYEYLKLLARFVRIAGYGGLLVCIDELVVLSHRLNNRVARNNNYEAILRILNDCLQGNVEGLGFIFAATDECLTDPRRGLFSYEALATRLAANRFAGGTMVDLSGPVLKLPNLSPEDCYVLLHNLRRVHAGADDPERIFPEAGIEDYLKSCQARMGAAYFQTPRDTIKDFLNLLNVLRQNPSADWRLLISGIKTTQPQNVDPSEVAVQAEDAVEGDDLTSFRL